jgi:farnesyl-diphosphate farnesyltransferase
MSSDLQAKAANQRREAFLEDLRSRGIIKEQTEEQKEAARIRMEEEANAPFPWFLVIGVVLGILAVMAALGGGIAYVIWKYSD